MIVEVCYWFKVGNMQYRLSVAGARLAYDPFAEGCVRTIGDRQNLALALCNKWSKFVCLYFGKNLVYSVCEAIGSA